MTQPDKPRALYFEHDLRQDTSNGGLHPDVLAAYAYVELIKHTADAGPHAWHGWALREAFLAGMNHARKEPSEG